MELGPGPLSPQATGDRALVTLLKLVMLKLSEWSSVHPSSTSAFPSSFLSIAIGKHQLNPACGPHETRALTIGLYLPDSFWLICTSPCAWSIH